MEQQQQQQDTHSCIVEGIAGVRRVRPDDYNTDDTAVRLTIQQDEDADEDDPIDRQSWQHLVDYLDAQPRDGDDDYEPVRVVTELFFFSIHLPHPSDGGLQVLIDFFARSDTTVTKVTLLNCDLDLLSKEDASQLLSAFENNRTVTGLYIESSFENLEGAALGACLSSLMQNNASLQRLQLAFNTRDTFNAEALSAFQPGLRTNRTLTELNLSFCYLRDEGIRLIADALVGNTTMEVLIVRHNSITSVGLADITRLAELTWLKTIDFNGNNGIFDDNATTQGFAAALSRNAAFLQSLYADDGVPLSGTAAAMIFRAIEHNTVLDRLQLGKIQQTADDSPGLNQLVESLPRIKCLKWLKLDWEDLRFCLQHCSFPSALHKNESLQELPGIHDDFWGFSNHVVARKTVRSILARNGNLVHTKSLLALQPRTGMPIGSKSGLWYMAFWKWTSSDQDNDTAAISGASAIYMVLQARPAILEKQLRRPAVAAASSASSHVHPRWSMQGGPRGKAPNNNGSGSGDGNISLELPGGDSKRQRLS